MEVFEVIKFTCYDYVTSINTALFAEEESAKQYYEELVNQAKAKALMDLDDDERVEDISETEYEVYEDGYASHYDVSIYISKKEVK